MSIDLHIFQNNTPIDVRKLNENFSDVGDEINTAKPRAIIKELNDSYWGRADDSDGIPYWYMAIEHDGITPDMIIDITPTVKPSRLINNGISLIAESLSNHIGIYAFGARPSWTFSVRLEIREVQ